MRSQHVHIFDLQSRGAAWLLECAEFHFHFSRPNNSWLQAQTHVVAITCSTSTFVMSKHTAHDFVTCLHVACGICGQIKHLSMSSMTWHGFIKHLQGLNSKSELLIINLELNPDFWVNTDDRPHGVSQHQPQWCHAQVTSWSYCRARSYGRRCTDHNRSNFNVAFSTVLCTSCLFSGCISMNNVFSLPILHKRGSDPFSPSNLCGQEFDESVAVILSTDKSSPQLAAPSHFL